MVDNNDISCSLCAQGKGCSRLFSLFNVGAARAPIANQPLQSAVVVWAYGLPLATTLSCAVFGAYWGEIQSIIGFGIGMLAGFFLIRIKASKHLS